MKSVTGQEFLDMCVDAGWTEVRVNGSHHRLRKGGRRITIPVHKGKDLDKGLLRSLLRATGLSLP